MIKFFLSYQGLIHAEDMQETFFALQRYKKQRLKRTVSNDLYTFAALYKTKNDPDGRFKPTNVQSYSSIKRAETLVAMPLSALKERRPTMRKYLYSENGFVEKDEWRPDCWVNVECPDDNDFKYLTEELKVPESFLEDIADVDERPRTETENNWLLTILRIPMQSNQRGVPFITVPIGIITNDEIIVSVCYHHTELMPDFIQHTRRKGIVVNNKLDLILRIIYSSAVWFLKYLKQINNDVATAEKELEKSIRNEDLLQLMKLQKTLVYFNTSIRGNEIMIGRLKNIFQDTNYLNRELLEDVIIELRQAYNTVNIYSDILTGTMDAFASIISNNVNAIMKRMTSLSITLMIPTLIASFYGMNVDIHLRNFPHAFMIIILLSAALSAFTFVWFRKIRWF